MTRRPTQRQPGWNERGRRSPLAQGSLRRPPASSTRRRPTPLSRSTVSGRPSSSGVTSSAWPQAPSVAAGSTRSSSPAASICPRQPRWMCRMPFAASPPAHREHRLRLPARNRTVHRSHSGAARPRRGPELSHRRGRRLDPARRRSRGGRRPGRRAAGVGEGARGARCRRPAIRRGLTPISEQNRDRPRAGRARPSPRPAPRDGGRGDAAGPGRIAGPAGRLHPTPAVAASRVTWPWRLSTSTKGFDRGWYAGPVGWLSADGHGELMVALRCGWFRIDA